MAATRKSLPSSTRPVVTALAEALSRHVPANARLTLGFSGGLDSTVLLHAILGLRDQHAFQLQAIHIHHGLSPHADQWATRCADACATQGVEFQLQSVLIGPGDPAGVEGAARRERQRVFAALDTDFVLTAHHQDDQAETLLLQLLRGAGPKGLAAMPEWAHPTGWRPALLRPLLNVSRMALLAYAQAHGLEWVEDESNRDPRYRRNALRHHVLPLLAGHFPGSGATLARAAGHQADAAALLDELAQLDARDAIAGDRLDCGALGRLSTSRARNLLRYFFEQQGQPMPSQRQLGEALSQLLAARNDARVRVQLGERDLWRFRGGAYLVAPAPHPAAPVAWHGETSIWVASADVRVYMDATIGAGLKRSQLMTANVTLGVRQGGERLRVHAGGPHRSLKNLLQEHAIPPWHRARLPLLWCGGELAWVAGIGFNADLVAAPGEPGVLPRLAQ